MISFNNSDILKEYDVIVVGSGPAGFCAAIQSARLGKSTALIERYGMLGGALTVGGIVGPMSFHAGNKQIISGIGWELMTRLAKDGWAELPDVIKSDAHISQVKVNATMAAHYIDIMCEESSVDVYLHQPVVHVETCEDENFKKVETLFITTKEGIKGLKAKVVVDCSGDGDIAAWSGAEYLLGDQETKELQPGSLSFYLTGYKMDELDDEVIEKAYQRAKVDGLVSLQDYWGEQFNWGASTILRTHGRNLNHITINGADSKSRSNAERQGRASVARLANWAKNYLGDKSEVFPLACAPEVWVRESRRIVGESYITGKDYVEAKKYDDGICYCFYNIDIHRLVKGDEEIVFETDFLRVDNVPQIPFSALIVKGFSNLLVAGRCISGDRVAQSAYRIQATCMAAGQAAGALAAMSAGTEENVRNIDFQDLKNTLISNGAIVPE